MIRKPCVSRSDSYVVALRPYTGQAVARVHYALLGVLGREAAGRVRYHAAELQTAPIGGLRLALDDAGRRAARARAQRRATIPPP